MPDVDETLEPSEQEESQDEEQVETEGEPQSEAPPVSTTPAARTDSEELTPREKALMEKVRAQEKQKLYKELTSLRERVRQFESQPPAAPDDTTRRKKKSDEDDVIVSLQQEIREMREESRKERRERELKDYRVEKIAAAKTNGVKLIESLVFGNSEEEIDVSFDVAKAEAQYLWTEFEREQAPAPRANNGRTVIVREGARRQPEGVPPTLDGAGSGNDSNRESFSKEEISRLASMDSIYDGTWAANRKKIISALRQGKIS